MTDAYLFAYFTDEQTPTGETIRFAVTEGDDPTTGWRELADGQPLFTSTLGKRGLRDPHIVRDPQRGRFFLIATDLRIYGGNDFGTAQQTGSRSIMVWESDDLVTWSSQRMVEAMGPEAGNVWAPEAIWDEERGEFFVFWASALYPAEVSPSQRSIKDSYQRMFYATTRDFREFSAPTVWIDEPRGTGLGFIDSTIVRDGEWYYRFTKDEAHMLPRLDRSRDLRSTSWELVTEKVGLGQANPWGGTFTQGEGPTAFRCRRDGLWYLFIDQPHYHGGRGYLGFVSEDLGAGAFTSIQAALPPSPRHGTVLPISAAERDRLVRRWGTGDAVASAAALAG